MNPTVALIVPLATDCPDRLAAWDWVRARYRAEHLDWEIVTGTTEGPWSKARAVADALTRTDADLLVIADADCWCPNLATYVDQVGARYEWATPHSRVIRLNLAGTRQLLDGDLSLDLMPLRALLDQSAYAAMLGGGIVVVPRALYEQVPLDPRFEGWGGEDESWGRALCTMTSGRSKRLHGNETLWHLYHEPQQRLNRRVGNLENAALTERYRAAAGDREATRKLIEEVRCSRTSASDP